MQLLSLTLDGFKSFAHKTTIKFEEGMTGIVGPNGSGKSNIIEAIRWVMGEQSARHLRGDKMADVIFNGSTDRAPLNRALVSITFDNSDHYLASNFTELTITRKLYRNGDSEYLINGQKVRLKDIVDLFIDSGLGRESFSIISQGRIEAVFNGKPADRRAIIEAVAGVAKYRKNKETAEKRLSATMDNLNRVNDIISELNSQLEPLADQSALAKDYLEQKKQLDLFDRTQLVRSYDRVHEQLTATTGKVAQAKRLANQYQDQAKVAASKLTKLKKQRADLLNEKDRLQQAILWQTELIAGYNSKQSVSTVKHQQQQRERDRLQDQLAKNKVAASSIQDQLADLKKQEASHQAAMESHQTDLADAERLTGQEQIAKLQGRLNHLRDQQINLLQKQTTLHNQENFLKQGHQQRLSQEKQSNADLATRQEKHAALEKRGQLAQDKIDQLTAQVKDCQAKLADTQQKLADLTNQYQETQRQWYQALGDAHSTESQIRNFRAMEEEYAGYYRGVQAVLKNRQQFPGLAGAVSELVEVPAKLTTAIETVLGGQLQQLVVDSQTTGKQIIHYLINKRAGRVTILPLNTLSSRQPVMVNPTVVNLPGYIGRATDLIKYENRYQIIVNHLLANTVIVDNLDHATAVARAGHHQLRVVTLDGQLINASGAMTGGANRHHQHGLLSQRQSGKKLDALLKRQQDQAKQLEKRVAALQASHQRGQAQVTALQEKLHSYQGQLQDAQGQSRILEDQRAEIESQISTLKRQFALQDDQHQDFQSALADNQAAQKTTDQQLAQVQTDTQEVNQQIRALQTDADSQSERIHQLRQWLAVAKERSQQYDRQKQNFDHQLAELNAAAEQLRNQRDQLARELQSADDTTESTAAALAMAKKKLMAHQAQLKDLNRQVSQVEDQVAAAENDHQRLQELERAAKDDLNDLNERRVRSEGKIDQLLNRLNDNYSMTIDAARQKVDKEISDSQLAIRLKLLRRGIAELGEVNVSSIEEYDRVKERYDFLKGQQTDLLESRNQLQQTMAEMDGQVEQRFTETFKKVSAAFNETFQQIFAGGQAKLVLTDPHDLLNTGVDIMAQPPGKKNQHMNLLSGGERALTAITLLFAILKVRPVPFAILDEPEAALDEVNVQRFANYLNRFGKTGPQFIVITHRKGTMMGANVLYGVTMQESGVSKMVSVDVVENLNEENKEE